MLYKQHDMQLYSFSC